MAHYVGKVLHLRPSEILDTWNVPELIVTYGNYANEQSHQNFEEWKQLDNKQKMKYPRPPEYAVKFLGTLENIDDGNR